MLILCCMDLLWLILGGEGVLLACIPPKMGLILHTKYSVNTLEIACFWKPRRPLIYRPYIVHVYPYRGVYIPLYTMTIDPKIA